MTLSRERALLILARLPIIGLTYRKMFLKCSHLILEVMAHDRDIGSRMAPGFSDLVAHWPLAVLIRSG